MGTVCCPVQSNLVSAPFIVIQTSKQLIMKIICCHTDIKTTLYEHYSLLCYNIKTSQHETHRQLCSHQNLSVWAPASAMRTLELNYIFPHVSKHVDRHYSDSSCSFLWQRWSRWSTFFIVHNVLYVAPGENIHAIWLVYPSQSVIQGICQWDRLNFGQTEEKQGHVSAFFTLPE